MLILLFNKNSIYSVNNFCTLFFVNVTRIIKLKSELIMNKRMGSECPSIPQKGCVYWTDNISTSNYCLDLNRKKIYHLLILVNLTNEI